MSIRLQHKVSAIETFEVEIQLCKEMEQVGAPDWPTIPPHLRLLHFHFFSLVCLRKVPGNKQSIQTTLYPFKCKVIILNHVQLVLKLHQLTAKENQDDHLSYT